MFANVPSGQTSRIQRYELDEVGQPTVHPRGQVSLDERTCEALTEFEDQCMRARVRGFASGLRSAVKRSRLLLEASVRPGAMVGGARDATVLEESSLDGVQLLLLLADELAGRSTDGRHPAGKVGGSVEEEETPSGCRPPISQSLKEADMTFFLPAVVRGFFDLCSRDAASERTSFPSRQCFLLLPSACTRAVAHRKTRSIWSSRPGSLYVVLLVPAEEADLDAFEQTCSKHRQPRDQPSTRDSFVEEVEVKKTAAVD
jgi:hypothetical protein